MKQIDEKTLRRIIVEEVRRALAERQNAGKNPVAPADARAASGARPLIKEQALENERSPDAGGASEALPSTIAKNLGRGLLLCTLPDKAGPEIIGSLKHLQGQGVVFSAFISPDLKSCGARACFTDHAVADCLADVDVEHFPAFSHEFQFLLLPGLSTEVAVHAVWGKTEMRAVKVLVECLRWRLPVFLCCRGQGDAQEFPWAGDPVRGWPLWIRENMHQFRRTLRDWGLREIAPAHLADEILTLLNSPRDETRSCAPAPEFPSAPRTRLFLTARDIKAMIQDGERKINLPPNATLTAEAADLASQHNLHISFK